MTSAAHSLAATEERRAANGPGRYDAARGSQFDSKKRIKNSSKWKRVDMLSCMRRRSRVKERRWISNPGWGDDEADEPNTERLG